MKIIIESKARPCPGVTNAISKTEELLFRNKIVYLMGQLIHNQREIDRLKENGLKIITWKKLLDNSEKKYSDEYFLIRSHGELEEVVQKAKEKKFNIVDATCPIVQHSHELITKHIQEGWKIVIVGNKKHQEVNALLASTNGNGMAISTLGEIDKHDFDNRSLIIAQTTIDPDFFSKVRKKLLSRFKEFKVIDTTCRFLHKRKKQIKKLASKMDVVILVGGKQSSNCKMLYEYALKYNKRSYKIEKPDDINKKWLNNNDTIGITGGASTPRWQLNEVKSYIEKNFTD
ncbi:MAG: 4-hydroxy-3-methylbut-2-enyl diphosphate reductase [bacterium]